MGKIECLTSWSSCAAIASVADILKDNPSAQVVIMFRKTDKHYAEFRAANVTNAESGFLADEFKHDLMTKCHDCRCKSEE